MHGMTKEDIQISANGQENQGHHEYIEFWFQTNFTPKHHTPFQQFFPLSQSKQLVLHVLVFPKLYFSNLNINTFVTLLRTWLH